MPKEIFIKNQNGQLLLEVLIVIAVAAIIISLSANFVFLSLRSNKVYAERNIAAGLADEAIEAIHAGSTEKWTNLYNLTHGTTDYHPIISSGKWDVTAAATETITLNNIAYTRGFRVYYVCKDSTTRNLTGLSDSSGASETGCVTSGGVADPSTQKIVVTISWSGNSISENDYLSDRFLNRACNQTTWATGSDSGVYSCASGGTPSSGYSTKCDIDTTVNTEIKLAENC